MATANIDDLVSFAENQPEYDESLTPAEKCIRGQPLQRTWHQFTSTDGKFLAGTWESEPGCWRISYTENEYFRILSGHSVLRDQEGNEKPLGPGDEIVIPAGFTGEWEVIKTTRKIYVIYQP